MPSVLTATQKDEIVESMKDSDETPWCSGVVRLSSGTLPLFYKTGHHLESGGASEVVVRCLDLLNATGSELEQLSKACDPAKFGLNQENVLDESYRKAGKLDLENFALNLSPEQLGFSDIIRKALLTSNERNIVFERYKINVYGEGSFFKSHKDTPRSQSMFGSLVIVFPTPHEGGGLIVSHNSPSSTIDFAGILKDQPADTIAYAAFYSDVNHEVNKVTSGYRVSLTYNLYYADRNESEGKSSKLVHVPTNTSYERVYSKQQATLSKLLQDPGFLPEGGLLCFSLKHEYAVPTDAIVDVQRMKNLLGTTDKPLEPLKQFLKGSDAIVYNVCAHLGLSTALKFVYNANLARGDEYIRFSEPGGGTDWDAHKAYRQQKVHHRYLSDYGLKFDRRYYGDGFSIHSDLRKYCQKVTERVDATWVGQDMSQDASEEDPSNVQVSGTTLKSPYMAYGNEALLAFIYGAVALVVSVGPHGKRNGFEMQVSRPLQVQDDDAEYDIDGGFY